MKCGDRDCLDSCEQKAEAKEGVIVCLVFIPAIISLFNINKDSYIFFKSCRDNRGKRDWIRLLSKQPQTRGAMIKYATTASVFALSSTFRLPLRRVARFRQKEVKTGCLVKFEFQINKESYFSIYLMQYLGRIPWPYSLCSLSHTIHCFFIFSWLSYAVFICGFDP